MKVNQIYSILNDINEQYWGIDGVSQNDLTGLISLGNKVLSSSDDTDVFINALVDRIGKTVIRTLDLELDFPKLFMDTFEFGCILQKLTVLPFEMSENDSWNIGEADFSPSFTNGAKPSILQKLFTDSDTWKVQIKIPHYQIESAFTSAESMNSFISAIVESMTDSMTMSINNMARTCICNFIAEKVKAENGVINLLSMYKTDYPNDNTVTDYTSALASPTFLRYAGMVMRNVLHYMSKPSVLYNVGEGVLRATARDNCHVMLTTDFVSSYYANYMSDSSVFHSELVDLPLYQEVEYWQGSGDSIMDRTDMSKINVIPSSDTKQGSDGTAEPIVVTGVVGLFADRNAIGVGLEKIKSGSWVNPIDHYTIMSKQSTIQYFNDLTENGVCFIIMPTE